MKKLACILLALALMLTLCACSRMTAPALAEKMVEALDGRQMTEVNLAMDMEISIAMEGLDMSMDMTIESEALSSTDPYMGYAETETSMSIFGESMTTTVETYTLEENGTVVNYTYDESTDTWTRQDSGMSLDDLMPAEMDYEWITDKDEDELELEEETTKLHGTECYVLHCTITGKEMQEAMGSMSGLTAMFEELGMEELDFSKLEIPATYWIDKETFLPVEIEMTIEGMDEMMDGLMSSLMGQSMEGFDMEISPITVLYTDISYDEVDVPELPEEAKDAADIDSVLTDLLPEEEPIVEEPVIEEPAIEEPAIEEPAEEAIDPALDPNSPEYDQTLFNPDIGDGTFVIQESGEAARITVPEGFFCDEEDRSYDTVFLISDDYTCVAGLVMFYDYDVETFYNDIEVNDVVPSQEGGTYVDHFAGPTIGNAETAAVTYTTTSPTYYARIPTSDHGVVLVIASDVDGGDLETVMTPLIEAVEFYDLYA